MVDITHFANFLSLFVISGCDSEWKPGDIDTHYLKINILGEGRVEPTEGEYERKSKVELIAEAERMNFYRWEGEVTVTDEESISIMVDDDKEVTVIFIEEDNKEGFAGWEGTEDKPFLIKDVEELKNVRDYLGVNFVLIDDLDLSTINNWEPIGEFEFVDDDYEYEPFSGTFDGRGHKIINLTINHPSDDAVGLFAIVKGALIKDVDLLDVSVEGKSYVGALTGISHEASTIERCSSTGEVSAEIMVGGLVGTNAGNIISNSYSEAEILGTGHYLESLEHPFYVANAGGLVGGE